MVYAVVTCLTVRLSICHNRCFTEMAKHSVMQTGCKAALHSAVSEMIIDFKREM